MMDCHHWLACGAAVAENDDESLQSGLGALILPLFRKRRRNLHKNTGRGGEGMHKSTQISRSSDFSPHPCAQQLNVEGGVLCVHVSSHIPSCILLVAVVAAAAGLEFGGCGQPAEASLTV